MAAPRAISWGTGNLPQATWFSRGLQPCSCRRSAGDRSAVARSINAMLAVVVFKEEELHCMHKRRRRHRRVCRRQHYVAVDRRGRASNRLLRLHSDCCAYAQDLRCVLSRPAHGSYSAICARNIFPRSAAGFCCWVCRKVKTAALETVKAGQPTSEVLQQLEAELEAIKLEQVSRLSVVPTTALPACCHAC